VNPGRLGDRWATKRAPSGPLPATLYRPALEVAATRLILLRADGGEVIRAFGNFVVAGNLVVGAVIFLILRMVQKQADAEWRETEQSLGVPPGGHRATTSAASRSSSSRVLKWTPSAHMYA